MANSYNRQQQQQKEFVQGEMSSSRLPVLVILGATGSGKSRLGIELARRFGGEVISADSMQVYKGLDIITAKVTREEQSQAKHHMLDVIDPLEAYTVVDYRNKALQIIDSIMKTKKVPVIVGGTNYYIESLLWETLIDDPRPDDSDNEEQLTSHKIRRIEGVSNEELHRKLMEVDPEMANGLHPNNRRKIIRSLEIFERHGTKHSEILRQQRLAGGCGLGGPLRFRDAVILWLTCSTTVLDDRLNSRVDSMLEAGLVQELLDFHDKYNKDRIQKNQTADYTIGIFQSIGFKEFHEYLILPKEERESEKGCKLLNESIENLKLATRRYARRQHKWVRNRILRRADRQVPPVYSLDTTDVNQWEKEVYGKAQDIVSTIMCGEKPSQKPLNAEIVDAKITDSSTDQTHFCEICERRFIGDLQYNEHLVGAKHRKQVNKKQRLAEEAEIEQTEGQNS